VAQSRAATWHPMNGLLVLVKYCVFTVSQTDDLPTGQRTGRAGLTARPPDSSCLIYG
jgi:hypothetical protein